MNLLHDIAPGTKDEMNVIIEIPNGSRNKYEIDKETGMIALDRVLHTAQAYPFDYGFVPQTLWDDGDALDVVLLTTQPLLPGILVHARPIGVLPMVDGGEPDEKVLAVPANDPRFADIKDLSDVNKHTLKEISHFFETYKKIQNKEVSLGEWQDKEAAQSAFTRACELYTAKK
ncbi:inorganic diphosphatase [Patescibacteria group bacterium]|nr:inorganic diphosphatase [Patescibacteria group bacterium]MBU1500433.1 inorganic diphosphatase [Patescibacteria group bacterium]MBU2080501.1 inorganic diphosphatase [Patescibacteria group bacterium]MBU2123694.1 inorganic diphosphatase [Patescibacteria group bacterium]MBU2194550.1 inorganic diphosphatase [Patescibacteria group bacterium]